ncbi:hypothetical protein [Streptomyces sp. NPDC046261]|uniref:hypothetical protein n=1 Tax=Streptomyces sp. NPDC046261 TaxID=3157200 RepID=UPI0033E438E1
MSSVRRFSAAIAASALLALGGIALATPAQAADGSPTTYGLIFGKDSIAEQAGRLIGGAPGTVTGLVPGLKEV